MTRPLCQLVALEKGVKGRVDTAVTNVYQQLQKPALYAGFSKTYAALNEEGSLLPGERTLVQRSVEADLRVIANRMAELFDVSFTRDAGNMRAVASVEVDGQVLVSDAPVPYLLFLQKQLIHLKTVFGKLPVLDPADIWLADSSVGGWRNEPVETIRSIRKPKVLLRAPSTDKFPAQTEVYQEDVPVGRWTTVKFSGAVTQARKDQLLARVDKLSDAVKVAVEAANQLEVHDYTVGVPMFNWLLR